MPGAHPAEGLWGMSASSTVLGGAPGSLACSRERKELPSANTLRINRLFFHYHTVCVAEIPEDTFPVYGPACLLAVKGLEGGATAA